jgi:hypothetical protein
MHIELIQIYPATTLDRKIIDELMQLTKIEIDLLNIDGFYDPLKSGIFKY